MQAVSECFLVGERLIEPRANRVVTADSTVVLEPKVMQVLLCLAAQPGEVVDRTELLQQVWGNTVVTDHVLTRAISELRKALGDDTRHPAVIETIPKTGYRLIATIRRDVIRAAPASRELAASDSIPDHLRLPAERFSRPPVRQSSWLARGAVLSGLCIALVLAMWLVPRSFLPQRPMPLERRPFTSFPGAENDPAFAPDGNLIAFTWAQAHDDYRRLYLKARDTESLLQLTHDSADAHAPVWSPDGRQLAFRRSEPDGQCGIYLIAALGGAQRKLLECERSAFALAWSPDGEWLAVATSDRHEGAFGLSLFSVEQGTMRPLTRAAEPYQADRIPRFSPDGKWLAYVRSTAFGMGDLYLIPADGRMPARRLTFDNRTIAGLAWMPDGRHLLFSSNRGGAFGLWRLAVSSGTPQWMAAAGAYDPGEIDVAADGTIAYAEWLFEINLWRASLDEARTAQPERIVASTRWAFHPQLSPDGARLAFASNRSGSLEIWTSQADGTQLMRLTHFDGPFVGMPRWSPDGRRLAFHAWQDGHARLFVIDADGGTPRVLSGEPHDDRAPSWSRDGRWIYFASTRSGEWQIWRVASAGGEAVQVTQAGGYVAFESPDGAALYFSKYGAAGLWRMPASGGQETLIAQDLAQPHWGNWTIAPSGIYYVAGSTNDAVINRLDPATGEARAVHSLHGRVLSHEPGLTVSPDGRWLVYGLADRVESDLILVKPPAP